MKKKLLNLFLASSVALSGTALINPATAKGKAGNPPRLAKKIRSFDGTGHNAKNPNWGAAGINLNRASASVYTDGLSVPAGATRPSPRLVSNTIGDQPVGTNIPSALNLTDMHTLWGQFIDHDIDLTPVQMGATPELFPIPVPTGDPFFDPGASGTQIIPLTRSIFDPLTCSTNPRQQKNVITAWVDASLVYGSSKTQADGLRTFTGGKMKTTAGDLLPKDGTGSFVAGDGRVNENVALTAMHTLFVREHNRLCDEFAAAYPTLNDEELYQKARNYVAALIQVITYNEYLPALLGPDAMDKYKGYDKKVDPGIVNVFSTAAFRFGHSTVSDTLLRLDNDGNVIPAGNLDMKDAFFNPSLITRYNDIGYLLKGQSAQVMQELDPKLVSGLRNFLFGPPGAGGLDLFSLNVQRGRDHGLPSYNAFRAAYGLTPYTSFSELTSDTGLAGDLTTLYGTVDDLDVWVGILSEEHLPNASMGELGVAIVADQFERLRDGDSFWYTKTMTRQEAKAIAATTLADVIKRNTQISNIADDVFHL